jgi:hypothetical protein
VKGVASLAAAMRSASATGDRNPPAATASSAAGGWTRPVTITVSPGASAKLAVEGGSPWSSTRIVRVTMCARFAGGGSPPSARKRSASVCGVVVAATWKPRATTACSPPIHAAWATAPSSATTCRVAPAASAGSS